jgi:hypothetical protein
VSPLRRRPGPREDEATARELRDRTVVMMLRMQRAGAEKVAIDDVLVLLGAAPAQAEPPPRDPLADPITGCRPATPG